MRSGGHASTGRGCRPVVEAADVDYPIVPQAQDLPALRRSARLASRRCAGDLKPQEKCPSASGHLRVHRTCAGGSRAGPPRDDLVAVVAVGLMGTLRCAPPSVRVEQIPDAVKIAGLQGRA